MKKMPIFRRPDENAATDHGVDAVLVDHHGRRVLVESKVNTETARQRLEGRQLGKFYGGGRGPISLNITVTAVPKAGLDLERAVAEPAKSPLIVQPPGRWMRTLAEFLFSKTTLEYVFEPLIADHAYEWSEAVAQNRPWKARWIPVRYSALFVLHVIAQGPMSALKIISDILKLI